VQFHWDILLHDVNLVHVMKQNIPVELHTFWKSFPFL